MVVRISTLEWLPDLGLGSWVGVSSNQWGWDYEKGGAELKEYRKGELIFHMLHIGEVAQESVGMWCAAQERGWRRDIDLAVLWAPGIGEVMSVDKVIHSESEFGIIQGQFLIRKIFLLPIQCVHRKYQLKLIST